MGPVGRAMRGPPRDRGRRLQRLFLAARCAGLGTRRAHRRLRQELVASQLNRSVRLGRFGAQQGRTGGRDGIRVKAGVTANRAKRCRQLGIVANPRHWKRCGTQKQTRTAGQCGICSNDALAASLGGGMDPAPLPASARRRVRITVASTALNSKLNRRRES